MRPERPTGPVDRDVGAEHAIELPVVAREAGVKLVHVRRYLEFGLFEAHPAALGETPRFPLAAAARVARAERLRRDLGLNHAGAVLVCELLDRISELEARR